jgi:glutathione S-transferase
VLHPEPPLFGRGALDTALIEMWNRRVELHLLMPMSFVFRHLHPAMKEMEVPQVAAWGEANKPRVLAFLELLDRELKDRAHIAGADYSVADITAMIAVDFMRVMKLSPPDTLANLKRSRRGRARRRDTGSLSPKRQFPHQNFRIAIERARHQSVDNISAEEMSLGN